jgi:hypothetical protein
LLNSKEGIVLLGTELTKTYIAEDWQLSASVCEETKMATGISKAE